MNESQSRVPPLALALAILAFMLFYNLGRADTPFVYDAAHYWEYADGFLKDGNFSFVSYVNGLRGYLFPFLLFLIKAQAGLVGLDAKLLFHVYSAVFFATLAVYMLPWSFRTIFGWKVNLIGRALIAFLLFYFWRGHFLYPQSDFPAFSAFLAGTAFLAGSLKGKESWPWPLMAGVFMGAALNIRPVYQAALIILIPAIFFVLRKFGKTKTVRWFGLVFLGFALVLLPQFYLNRVHFQTNTPLVLTQWSDDNLYKKQLFWGLKTQKYEVNFGDNYPSLTVVYEDPLWLKVQKSPLVKDKTLENYFRLFQRFPVDFLISYFKHFFNGLDLFFPTPYLQNLYADHTIFSLFNYSIWFLVLIHLTRLNVNALDFTQLIATLGLILPVALAIPVVVEVRYFVAAHVLAYGVVAFGFDYKGVLASFSRAKWEIARYTVLYVLWLLACFTLSSTTIETLVIP